MACDPPLVITVDSREAARSRAHSSQFGMLPPPQPLVLRSRVWAPACPAPRSRWSQCRLADYKEAWMVMGREKDSPRGAGGLKPGGGGVITGPPAKRLLECAQSRGGSDLSEDAAAFSVGRACRVNLVLLRLRCDLSAAKPLSLCHSPS